MFRNMEMPQSKQEIIRTDESEDLRDIAQELGSEMKEAFAHATKKFFQEHPALKAEGSDELSVEVYERPQDIRSRIVDLQDEEAGKEIPKESALLVVRFPPGFKYEEQEGGSAKALFKASASRLFWSIRDEFQEDYGVEIERVNPVGEHEDTEMSGYYYIWLMTPVGKMPDRFREPETDWN